MFSTPEEDEMGSPPPRSAALEAARKIVDMVELDMAEGGFADDVTPSVARALDAYAAAALTDEQRDVLTVWEYGQRDGVRVTIYKESVHIHAMQTQDGMRFRGPDWLHAAATWCREQGAK